MSPGSNTESYPAFAHIGLRENPGKNVNQVTCPDRESNPGHLVARLDALTTSGRQHSLKWVKGKRCNVCPVLQQKERERESITARSHGCIIVQSLVRGILYENLASLHGRLIQLELNVSGLGGGGVCIFSSTPSGLLEDETKPQEIETPDFQFGARSNPGEERGGAFSGPSTQGRHHKGRAKFLGSNSRRQPNGSTRRVDILAYNADTKQGIIVDPTIRFEVECHQSAEVHLEKKSIYEPTVNYFKLKYALIHVEIFGLLIGARGTIKLFFEEF
ncbi:hypothetical protein ANN_23302 [Periplaneta americana]|uniref:Uncharacterized protein n=1 Tax=Periplaneta americana TaxID=6978 RepID=A0ABQ8SLM4_PERAM|nr:hypothetical protein ANN_23302 [Periplaneta americana]